MTLRQKMERRLQDCLLAASTASTIMDVVEKHPAHQSMAGRWNDDERTYDSAFPNTLWIGVRVRAIGWLEEHHPRHLSLSVLKGLTQIQQMH